MIFVIILQPYEKLTGNDIRHLELEIGSKNNCHNAAMQKKKKKNIQLLRRSLARDIAMMCCVCGLTIVVEEVQS